MLAFLIIVLISLQLTSSSHPKSNQSKPHQSKSKSKGNSKKLSCGAKLIKFINCRGDQILNPKSNTCADSCNRETKEKLKKGQITCPAANKDYLKNVKSVIKYLSMTKQHDSSNKDKQNTDLSQSLNIILTPISDCQILAPSTRLSIRDFYSNIKKAEGKEEKSNADSDFFKKGKLLLQSVGQSLIKKKKHSHKKSFSKFSHKSVQLPQPKGFIIKKTSQNKNSAPPSKKTKSAKGTSSANAWSSFKQIPKEGQKSASSGNKKTTEKKQPSSQGQGGKNQNSSGQKKSKQPQPHGVPKPKGNEKGKNKKSGKKSGKKHGKKHGKKKGKCNCNKCKGIIKIAKTILQVVQGIMPTDIKESQKSNKGQKKHKPHGPAGQVTKAVNDATKGVAKTANKAKDGLVKTATHPVEGLKKTASSVGNAPVRAIAPTSQQTGQIVQKTAPQESTPGLSLGDFVKKGMPDAVQAAPMRGLR